MLDLNNVYDDYELIDKKTSIINVCKEIRTYFLDYKGTLRMCEKEICVPRTTIHMYIHSYIKEYWYEDYLQIKIILDFNKSNRFKPRKYWIGKPW